MFNFFRKEKTKIKAVNDQDLIPYLKSLGVYEQIKEGKILCKFCGNKVSFKNLQALFPCGQDICFVCTNVKCLIKLHHD